MTQRSTESAPTPRKSALPEPAADPAEAVAFVREVGERIIAAAETVILGKRTQIEHVLAAILCRGHVLMEDVPGTGKTMLARALAGSMGLGFARLQCTPDLLPNDVTGFSVYDQHAGTFEFRPGPVFANILLADEINRATPRTQAALLEAMQEQQVTVDGQTRPLPNPFVVMATQNPIEYEGTFPLPEAQLDRFLLRVSVGYPSWEEERLVLRMQRGGHPVNALRSVATLDEIHAMAGIVAQVHVAPPVEDYILRLVRGTREEADLSVGASPRGSLALYKTAQALAALRGREYVTPEDVKEMAVAVLAHRIARSARSQLRGRTPSQILADLVESTPVDADLDRAAR